MLVVKSLSRVVQGRAGSQTGLRTGLGSNGRALVSDVSFSMAPGEIVAVLGPSGSGKTSLLRLVAGFDAPTSGSVQLHGQLASVAGRVLVPPERRALALAFQDATLFPHLDAVGNAAFGIQATRWADRQARARQALQDMGMTHFEGRDVATLSGGEAQRVALARALASAGRLLLLDEPFGNVDRLTRADLLRRLKAHLTQALGAIIITHDPADVIELDARLLLMRDGLVVADGSHQAIAAGAQGGWAQTFLLAGQ